MKHRKRDNFYIKGMLIIDEFEVFEDVWYAAVKCHCGNRFVCKSEDISKDRILSCGCLKKKYKAKYGISATWMAREYTSIRFRCKHNELYTHFGCEFKTLQQWVNHLKRFFPKVLEYSDWWDLHPIERIKLSEAGLSIQCHRIDSTKGYIKGNLRFLPKCCHREIHKRQRRGLPI